jgi:ATP synthase protein I
MQDIAASYLLGALGGIIYLRLLKRSVDSIGGASIGSAAGGLASQPRLLIPVILVLASNRYAAILFGPFFRSYYHNLKIRPF